MFFIDEECHGNIPDAGTFEGGIIHLLAEVDTGEIRIQEVIQVILELQPEPLGELYAREERGDPGIDPVTGPFPELKLVAFQEQLLLVMEHPLPFVPAEKEEVVLEGAQFECHRESKGVASAFHPGILVKIGVCIIDPEESYILIVILGDQPDVPYPEPRKQADIVPQVQVEVVLGMEKEREPDVRIHIQALETHISAGENDLSAAGMVNALRQHVPGKERKCRKQKQDHSVSHLRCVLVQYGCNFQWV